VQAFIYLPVVAAFRDASEEERLSYFTSLERDAAVDYDEVRSAAALKRGVGDHAAEQFADHELGSRGGSDLLELLCGPHGRAILA
jgi:hypothetical protein